MSKTFYDNLALINDIAALAEGRLSLEEIESIAETDEKQHNPFRRFKKLGSTSPGKRKGADEKGDWECSKTSAYAQKCVGVSADTEGRVKHIKIQKGWKKKYNHDYKTGQASGAYKPATRSGGKTKKAKKGKSKKSA